MGPAHADICRRAGKVCIRYVDRPVASEAHYEFSLKSKRDRTCPTSRRVELFLVFQPLCSIPCVQLCSINSRDFKPLNLLLICRCKLFM